MAAGGGAGGEPGLGLTSRRATVLESQRAAVRLLVKPTSTFFPPASAC